MVTAAVVMTSQAQAVRAVRVYGEKIIRTFAFTSVGTGDLTQVTLEAGVDLSIMSRLL